MGNRFDSDGTLKTESTDGVSGEDFMDTVTDPTEKEIFDAKLDPSQNSQGADAQYLVRGALLRCEFGSHARRLNLPVCHGVYHLNRPAIHQKDAKVGDDQNIPSFGVCSSSKHPEDKWFGEDILLVSEDDPEKNVKGCPCTPIIVDNEWKNPKWDTLIADNAADAKNIPPEQRVYYPTVTTDSFLVCKYCGLIEPETSGQEVEE